MAEQVMANMPLLQVRALTKFLKGASTKLSTKRVMRLALIASFLWLH